MKELIARIVDEGEFFELQPDYAKNIIIGFGYMEGAPVGFVANQPLHLAGCLDIDASRKAARFIRFCFHGVEYLRGAIEAIKKEGRELKITFDHRIGSIHRRDRRAAYRRIIGGAIWCIDRKADSTAQTAVRGKFRADSHQPVQPLQSVGLTPH